MIKYPSRIICLTEESVELLFALKCSEKIIGRSCFVKRPKEALSIPIVSKFTSSDIDTITKLKPDLVLGFSDIQKDIARDLIAQGVNVFISNQRSLDEILQYILSVSGMVGKASEGQSYVIFLQTLLKNARQDSTKLLKKPKVYFEEWDSPYISGINWVSEILEACGAIDIMKGYSHNKLAKDRMPTDQEIIEANPDIILASWCGKKVKKQTIYNRKGWERISAIQNKQVYELEPEVFLQPGPAPFIDGINILQTIFNNFQPESQL